MGGETFETQSSGKTALEAFDAAVSQAQWDHGHSGHSGTIAEKHEFVEFTVPDGVPWETAVEWAMGYPARVPERYAAWLTEIGKIAQGSKWGPAACFKIAEHDDDTNEYVFFGWASS